MVAAAFTKGWLLLVSLTMASAWTTLVRSSTTFYGQRLLEERAPPTFSSSSSSTKCYLEMRKQKASDRRTRRRQRGSEDDLIVAPSTITSSPMQLRGNWQQKTLVETNRPPVVPTKGRGRSRKRSTLYNSLAYYHNHFLNLLTEEYQAEEEEVLGRIKASVEDPLGLETAGYALFDLYVERRGNLFSDEVYRLTKAADATTVYEREDGTPGVRYMPSNHKFSANDVIMLTLQPNGAGDFFGPSTLPIADTATSVEARVLNTGPTYVDVAIQAGQFEAALGPAPNDASGVGNKAMRLRADRFLSKVPYERMVGALAQLTALPDRTKRTANPQEQQSGPLDKIHMDELLRETILSTFAYADPASPLLRDPDVCDLTELAHRLAKPPMASSYKTASQVLKFMRATPDHFRHFNAPQRSAIEAALTRRLTMIHGPPGTGKTTVAGAIAFGFAHQCRTLSPHTKVLSCAFSNVGADNLAQGLLDLGLKIVRIGKPSAVSESLWNHTLDAAIQRDPSATAALKKAAAATAQLHKLQRRPGNRAASVRDETIRQAATAAVQASIEATNIAASKALREADVIVSTSTGAADARLLAACGIVVGEDKDKSIKASNVAGNAPPSRELAPDGLPPLSLPFVIVDEACQSVEPAALVPIVASDSCRALVLLGDPCQLPPTVRSRNAKALSVSLMERLSATLPAPVVSTQVDNTIKDSSYLDSLPMKRAKSLLRSMDEEPTQRSYRKRFAGSLLLSVQYRMHPSISAFSSAIFYDGQLTTPTFMGERRKFPSALQQLMPCGNPDLCVRAIDVGGRSSERQGKSTRYSRTVFSASSSLEEQSTYWNEVEAASVLSLIKDMLRNGADPSVSNIGVISPYNGQVELIKSMIASDAELRDLLLDMPVTIEVKSVDGYQGRERDVIIFSAVRSNRQGRIGFLHDWRRLNVALTRAKSALLVVGDLDTLAEADKHWAAFVRWAVGARCVMDDSESPEDEVSV